MHFDFEKTPQKWLSSHPNMMEPVGFGEISFRWSNLIAFDVKYKSPLGYLNIISKSFKITYFM